MNTTLELNETTRLKIEYDLDTYAPSDLLGEAYECGWFFIPKREAYGINFYWNEKYSEGELTEKLSDTFAAAYEYNNYGETVEAIEKAVSRSAYHFEIVNLDNGHEYAQAVIYTLDATWLKGMRESLRAWFDGNIYRVELERLNTYTNTANGETRQIWDSQDSLCCVTYDTEAELIELAKSSLGYEAENV